MRLKPLREQTVVVTGAASGLGRGLALAAARKGATVVMWDRDGDALDAAVAEVDAARTGPALAPIGRVVDVTDRDGVRRAAEEAIDATGGIDVLVNNAGVVSGKYLTELALYWVTQAFLAHMMERDRGRVVTLASASGLIGVAKLTDYSASKWAAIGFDESLRVELARRGSNVATTVVCPFYIDTGMFSGVKSKVDWLLPILDPDHVVAKTVDAIERGKARVHLPPIVGTLPLMRMLPVRAFDAAAGMLGVNRTMDEFTGRRAAAAPSDPSPIPGPPTAEG